MTRVDFYILPDATADGRERFACRLAEKIYKMGHTLYLHTDSPEQAQQLDELLWGYKDSSFLPHSIEGDDQNQSPQNKAPKILISHHHETPTKPHSHSDVLINLAPTVPGFFSRFKRVAELINQAEDLKVAGRERFKFYRDRGYQPETHKI
ncbi:MAG: DNA polymerase III subunit chi [Thiotrichaceae bacterium]|nr:DNA polymerase III subunit chi [Thiotrichaceae bacterium]PCI14380.1 MAG: DNA polymerase III subunit chi [Thiotrichales bacterium]